MILVPRKWSVDIYRAQKELRASPWCRRACEKQLISLVDQVTILFRLNLRRLFSLFGALFIYYALGYHGNIVVPTAKNNVIVHKWVAASIDMMLCLNRNIFIWLCTYLLCQVASNDRMACRRLFFALSANFSANPWGRWITSCSAMNSRTRMI